MKGSYNPSSFEIQKGVYMINIRDAVERWAKRMSCNTEVKPHMHESSEVVDAFEMVVDDSAFDDETVNAPDRRETFSGVISFTKRIVETDVSNTPKDEGFMTIGETRIATSCEID